MSRKAMNFTEAEVLAAVEKSSGVMEYVAVTLGCSWDTARKYVNMYDSCKDMLEAKACRLNALAYQSFIKSITAGERWAVERILDTSARKNGHGSVQYAHLDHTSKGESISSSKLTDKDRRELIDNIKSEL